MHTESLRLITPTTLGSLSIPNRVLFAPLTRMRASVDNVPGALMAEHYAQRASAGLLFAEATMVSADCKAWMQQPSIHSDAHAEGWRLVTDAVHAAGGRIYLQVWHPGRATHSELNGGVQPVSSTARAIREGRIQTATGKHAYPVPRALETEEVSAMVATFAKACERAKKAGFDGVQLHAAHGYLIDQFLRSSVNDRSDVYGGSLENRTRFLFEIADAASAVFTAGRVGIRISPLVTFNDMQDENPAALVTCIAKACEARKLGFLELRHETCDALAEVNLAKIVRTHYQGALLRNGDFTRKSGEQALRENLADAIVYGRLFLANPDLPRRFLLDAPLNEPNPKTFYLPGSPVGYTDYPRLTSLHQDSQ
jgi:N-ethylmaleimide reductase